MRTLKPLNLDIKEIERLKNIVAKYEIEYDIKIVTPCEIILFYNKYENIEDVMYETGLSRKTIFNHLKQYKEDKYYMFKRKSTSNLFKFRDKIADNFKKFPVKSYREAASRIAKITGIKKSTTQIYYYLINNGYEKNKNGYYTKNGVDNTFPIKKDSYLYEHLEEIEKFINEQYVDNIEIMINRLKNHFPLIIENDIEIKNVIKKLI